MTRKTFLAALFGAPIAAQAKAQPQRLLTSQRLDVKEIARLFGVPAHLVAPDAKSKNQCLFNEFDRLFQQIWAKLDSQLRQQRQAA